VRKFFRITYYLGGILLFVLIAIIGYTQTRSFKTYLRTTILHESRTALNGQLQFGSIGGNLITGFTTDSVSIQGLSGEIISSDHIEFKYDLFGFFFKRIAISNIVILKPRIHLYRSKDGTWNVADLIKPVPEDSTPSAWTIDIKNFELKNAELVLTDSLLLFQRQTGESEIPSDSVIDYARIHLEGLSLATSVHIQNGRYEANLKNLEFASQKPTFVLKHLKGDFLLAKDEVRARNITLETLHSHLRIDAGLKEVDLLSIANLEDLKMKPVDVSFSAEDIDMRELKQFLYPSVDFLDRTLKLHLKVNGTFGDLNIKQLSVQMPFSTVQLHGHLRNLHSPRELEMTVQADDNVLTPRDLADCLPGLKLPDLAFLGTVRFSLTYEGRPLDFQAQISSSTAGGDVDIQGKMKIVPDDISYSGAVTLRSLALDTLFHIPKMSSDLNVKMTVDGTGFNPRTMTGLAKIEIDSSLFNGLSVRRSVGVFDLADGMLRTHIAASVGSGTYELSSSHTFFNQDSSSYSLASKIRSLDLGELLKEKQYGSDLSFDLTAMGISGKYVRSDTTDVHFYRSAFENQKFESAEARAIFSMKDSLRSNLQVESSIGDLMVDGNFSPGSFFMVWQNSYQLVTEAVAYRFQNLDSLRSSQNFTSAPENFQPTHIKRIDPLRSRFHLEVKDFRPIGAVIHVPLSGQGTVDGSVLGDSTALQMIGTVNLEQFGLRSGTDTLSADSAAFTYSFGGINTQTIFQTLSASLKTDLKDFTINGLLFNQLSGQLKVKSDSSDFRFSAFIDSTARMMINGTSRVQNQLMEFDLPKIRTEIGQYIAENEDTVRLALGCDGFRIRSMTMVHESEEAVLTGYFSPSGISDLNISLNGFLFSNLKQILHRGPYARSSIQFGGRMDASTSFKGSFKSPNIVVDLKADGVRAEDIFQNKSQVFGKIESRLAYFEHRLNLFVKFLSHPEDPQTSPDVLLSGSLPYEFVLAREDPHNLEGSVDLTLKAAQLDLKFLDPFIPEISNLSGIMVCDMRMKGPFEAPLYEGSMSIHHAGLVFDPLGIRYILNGDLIPAGDRIRLEQFSIQNDPAGGKPVGTMKVSGTFTLLGLKLKQFDILAQGDLKVMSEDKRFAGQKLYGNLFAASGPDGLHWKGNLSASMVRGDVFIKDAQLVLPPEREAVFVQTSMVNVTFLDDTSQNNSPISEEFKASNGKKKLTQFNTDGDHGTRTPSASTESLHSSFLDGISYDVSIETQGPTTLRFVFNTQTSEELYADLQGRLYFNRTPEISRLTGQIEVSNRSYYNFIKKFEATGKLLFTGDILNPELNVLGTYQGIHHAIKNTALVDSTYHSSSSVETEDEQVLVTLQVTGTRNEPKTKITLQTKTYAEKDWKKWEDKKGRSDEEANAISFILVGQFRDELTDQQRMNLIGSNLGLSLATGMATGPLSDLLRRSTWGYIQSVDVIYIGGQFNQSADLRLTGQVGEAVIRWGGRVLSDLSNSNVSVEVPVSSIVNSEKYRNLILTLERRVEGIQNAEEQRRASNGARLFYRFIF
jgi:hypothetical protein